MRPPAYGSYQEFNDEWLPRLPSHWQRRRLKFLASHVASGGTPTTGNDAFWGGDIPWVSPKDMKVPRIAETEDYLTEEGVRSSASNVVPEGTMLVVVRSGILRHSIPVALAGRSVAINQDIKAIVFRADIDGGYIKYFIEGLQGSLLPRWSKLGCTVESIEHEYMINEEVPAPPRDEQRAIVRFLDAKTAEIDALIAKKLLLLELLAEQRSALITKAVTRGLNPNAPMKPSGLPWLGDIPVHWEVKPLKFAVPGLTVGIVVTPSKYYAPEGIPALRGVNIVTGKIVHEDMVYISEDANELHSKSMIFEGDVVVVRTGKPGTAAVVTAKYNGANCIDLLIVRRSDLIISDYILNFINSDAAAGQVVANSVGAIQSHFNTGTLAELYIAYPGPSEQAKIVGYISEHVGRLDGVASSIQRAVDRLQEYRSALITAAVTGQIDVRGWEPRKAAA